MIWSSRWCMNWFIWNSLPCLEAKQAGGAKNTQSTTSPLKLNGEVRTRKNRSPAGRLSIDPTRPILFKFKVLLIR